MTSPARAGPREADEAARQRDLARGETSSSSGRSAGAMPSKGRLLHLQRAAGNAAVAGLLRPAHPSVQRLSLGGAVPRTLPDPGGPDIEEEIETGTSPEFLQAQAEEAPAAPEGGEDEAGSSAAAATKPGARETGSAAKGEAAIESSDSEAPASAATDVEVPHVEPPEASAIDATVPDIPTPDLPAPEVPAPESLAPEALAPEMSGPEVAAGTASATPQGRSREYLGAVDGLRAVTEKSALDVPVVEREVDLTAGTDALPEVPRSTESPPVASADVAGGPTTITPPAAGGMLEAAATAALSQLTRTATSRTQTGATQATTMARQGADAAGSAAGTAATTLSEHGNTLASDARSGLPAVTQSGSSILSSAVSTGLGGIRTMMQRLAGPIRTRVQAWVQSGGRGDLAADLLSPVRSAVMGIVRSIQAAARRVIDAVLGFVRRIAAAMRRAVQALSRLAQRIIQAISQALQRVLATVRRILNGVISAVMSVARSLGAVIASFVSRILSSVRAVISRILSAAEGLVRRVTRTLGAFVRRMQRVVVDGIRRLVAAVERIVRRVVALVERLISTVANLVTRALRAAYEFVVRMIRRAAAALARAILWLVLEWLKPKIEAALATAREMIERVRRYGQQYAQAAREGVRRTMALGRDLLQSLLKPEGDHFSIGLGGSIGGSGGAYVAGTGALDLSPLILDVHVSYRHLSFRGYLSVSAGLSGGVGVGGGGGLDVGVGGQVSWGSVLSYGREADMNASVGGWQVAGGVGAEVEAAAGPVGFSAGVGHQVSTNLGDIPQWAAMAPFGYNPVTGFGPPPPGAPVVGGPGFPGTVPGTQTPRPASGTWSGVGPGSPGPGREQYRPEPPQTTSGSILFPTGDDTVTPAHRTRISGIATSAGRLADGADMASVRGRVVGHASPRWRYPRERRTAEQENQDLSTRRAVNANSAAETAIRGISISAPHAISMDTPVGAGAGPGPADSDPQHQRRADVTYTVVRSVREEIPPPVDPHAPTPPPGQLPSLGWDTTASLAWTGKAGAEAHAAAKGSGSVSYTDPDPIWEENLGPMEAKALRIVLGLYKVTLGVAVGDQMGLIRDAAGLVGGVEDLIGVELTDPIVTFIIPMPESV